MAAPTVLRILVVEDDPTMSTLVCAILAPTASAVQFVRSGEEALAWLALEPVDAVVTDRTLAGAMDGLTLVQSIRAHWPSVRVVLTKGWTAPLTHEQALAAGAQRLGTRQQRMGHGWIANAEVCLLPLGRA